jgi:hypothetical protein
MPLSGPSFSTRFAGMGSLAFLQLIGLGSLAAEACQEGRIAAEDRLRQTRVSTQAAEPPSGGGYGAVIPGLAENAVPQGLAYLAAQDWFLISLYRKEHPAGSFLAAVDAKTGQMTRSLLLLNPDGTRHKGHVGGLAASDKTVWIGSGSVYSLPIAAIVEEETHGCARLRLEFKAVCAASFVTFARDHVWVGEFVKSDSQKYPGSPKPKLLDRQKRPVTAWLAGYQVAADGLVSKPAPDAKAVPDVLFGIPERVQAAAFHDDLIIFSVSYGRRQPSSLVAAKIPLEPTAPSPHARVPMGGREIPIWFAEPENDVPWIPLSLPPMAEGIAIRSGMLAILHESGASPYRSTAPTVIDRLVLLPISTPR